MKTKETRGYIFFFAATLLIGVLTYTITLKQMSISNSDYMYHALLALNIFQGGWDGFIHNYSYPIWHLTVKLFQRVVGLTLPQSVAITATIINVATLWVCVALFRKCLRDRYKPEVLVCVSTGLLIFEPISWQLLANKMTWWLDLINTWHNPANPVARVFGIMSFFLFIDIIDDFESGLMEIQNRRYVELAATMVLAGLSKPSFGQVFLPAGALFCIVYCLIQRFRPFSVCVRIALSFIPATLVIMLQSIVNFGSTEGVEIAWFDVMSHYGHNIFLSIIGYIIFPLVVMICFWKDAVKERWIQFAWGYWLVGLFEYAALAEVGERRYHMNFLWGYLIATFILNMVAMMKFLAYRKDYSERKVSIVLCELVFALEVLCGCIYIYWQLSVSWFWG